MKKFVFYGAGFWAFVHGLVIFLVLTAYLSPDFKSGVDAAIITTIRLMGIVAITTIVQIGFQIALASNRETNLSTGEKWFDGTTTFIPIGMTLFTWWWMSGMAARVAWWPTLSRWVFWIVLLATAVDLYNGWKGIKIWRGTAPANPPAPPAGGAGHH